MAVPSLAPGATDMDNIEPLYDFSNLPVLHPTPPGYDPSLD